MAGRETHVVLLPQGAGWEWYEALRDYVLRYRPTVTQSADDAVTFSGDPHIVTVIYPAAWNKPGVPRQPNQPDDIVAWLHKNSKSPGLQIDPVPWSDPAALKRALAERVLVLGRFGRGMRTPGGTLPPIDTKPTPPKPKPDEQALKLRRTTRCIPRSLASDRSSTASSACLATKAWTSAAQRGPTCTPAPTAW